MPSPGGPRTLGLPDLFARVVGSIADDRLRRRRRRHTVIAWSAAVAAVAAIVIVMERKD